MLVCNISLGFSSDTHWSKANSENSNEYQTENLNFPPILHIEILFQHDFTYLRYVSKSWYRWFPEFIFFLQIRIQTSSDTQAQIGKNTAK